MVSITKSHRLNIAPQKYMLGKQLPTKRNVLGHFIYLHNVEKKTIADTAIDCSKHIIQVWSKTEFPIKLKCNIISKIKLLYTQWINLKKNQNRNTISQNNKEIKFLDSLNDIFDISYSNIFQSNDSNKEFHIPQLTPGCSSTTNPELKIVPARTTRSNINTKDVDFVELERRTRKKFESLSSADDSSQDTSLSDFECHLDQPTTSKMRNNILNTQLTSALDRTNVSSRKATYILASALTSCDKNIKDYSISKDSIRRARNFNRKIINNEIIKYFKPNTALMVHWDGKMLPSQNKKNYTERLAVLVSGDGKTKLLGVPKLLNSTGQSQADAVIKLLIDWNLVNQTNMMCFDTTASNTGKLNGACILIEKQLGKELLSFACRHHIHEIIISRVFDKLMPPSTGPDIALFKRFFNSWENIDKKLYCNMLTDDVVLNILAPDIDIISKFCENKLNLNHPRDDYKELLELCLLFIGKENEKIKIHPPGALHRARWMAKIIYCLKIYMFRSQFKLTSSELNNIQQFNVFVLKVYIKYWFESSYATKAPNNDLNLIKELKNYSSINKSISEVAIKVFSGHLWYLNDILSGLSFFDEGISIQNKKIMVQALNKKGEINSKKRIDIKTVKENEGVNQFISENTKKLFSTLGINQEFLKDQPNTWAQNSNYIQAKNKVESLFVINDPAERGVALMTSFNNCLTNDEEQRQYLIQVVERHRNEYPDCKKATLVTKK
ncbi:uncharacterized protein LOC126905632 [Daktulosphaira vitifoliae]|uniref:uncharacterized protein LOC126905632 n=1 Tax=Daktulosphaira vitifoliae TaxID=58002 RepID=UPI0021AA02AC|nr:uncharacterized protein LOC126905632 [Daktulosphaira vitifoliae]